MSTLTAGTTELVIVRCWCGIQHAVPRSLRNEQLRQHNDGWKNVTSIHCPVGHTHSPVGETECDVLKRQLIIARARHDQTKADLRETEARRRGEKAAKTKLKNQIAAGLCPVCRRPFANLMRHMQGQHPAFAEK